MKVLNVTLKHHEDVARYGHTGITTETILLEDGSVVEHDIGAAGPYTTKTHTPPTGRICPNCGQVSYTSGYISDCWQLTEHGKQSLLMNKDIK